MPIEIKIHELTLPEFYKTLFQPFKRDYAALRETIYTEGYSRYEPLKVRKNKRKNKYEVICGVGRLKVLDERAAAAGHPAESPVTVLCEEMNLDNPAAIALACQEHLHTPAVFARFSAVQIILLARLHESLSGDAYGEERVMTAAGIAGTTYTHAVSSIKFALEKLHKQYRDLVQQLENEAAQKKDGYSEKLIDLRLVLHTVERNEWRAFTEFFFGRIKTNKFYISEYKPSEAAQRNRAKQSKAIAHHQTKKADGEKHRQTVATPLLSKLIKTKSATREPFELPVTPEKMNAQQRLAALQESIRKNAPKHRGETPSLAPDFAPRTHESQFSFVQANIKRIARLTEPSPAE